MFLRILENVNALEYVSAGAGGSKEQGKQAGEVALHGAPENAGYIVQILRPPNCAVSVADIS